ncbi:D-alanyl-D-alanine carboxypeptidase family protein [Egicoccus sp. AB-alg2]|uniref:D-alanyl-D-alanine carboxypeptidase family protein n=1 Tax=Egicoccus sp. AB-alg2 TaxID=3242693 RepID=UPI00359F05B3
MRATEIPCRRAAGLLLILALLLATAAPAPAGAALPVLDDPAVAGPPPEAWPEPAATEVPATSWVLVEASTGQRLAEHDAEELRPVASTIKVLTALTVVQRADLDEEVTVGREVLVEGASVGLQPGDTWTVGDLLEAILVRSGNDAAEALARHVGGDTQRFLELMEADIEALGLDARDLVSPTGLDDANRLSALDLATIARAALAEPELRPLLALRETTTPVVGPRENRNELLQRYDGATGVKTGFTLAAGNSLIASAQRDGRELIAVVLDAGDDPARFEQAAQLLDLGFDDFTRHELTSVVDLAVAGGWQTFTAGPVTVSAPGAATPDLVLDLPARVPETSLSLQAVVDGTVLAGVDAVADTSGAFEPARAEAADPAADPPAARLGQALVDGAYASLRAAAAADTLR